MSPPNVTFADDPTAVPGHDVTGGVSLSDHLQRFHQSYARYHGYVSVVVCAVGVLCNLFIILVLTKKSMINSTNLILTALAVSDLLTMLSYIPFALQFYVLYGTVPSTARNSLTWARYVLFHAHLSVTAHTVSIWLGVLLSIFRFSFVRQSSIGEVTTEVSRKRVTKMAIAGVYVMAVVCLLPNYLSLAIHQRTYPMTNSLDACATHDVTTRHHDVIGNGYDVTATADDVRNGYDVTAPPDDVRNSYNVTVSSDVIYFGDAIETNDVIGNESGVRRAEAVRRVTSSPDVICYYDVVGIEALGVNYGRIVTRVNFWMHAFVIKLIPCGLMSVFGTLIVCAVHSTHSASARLRRGSTRSDTQMLRQKEHNRTTSMLVIVIVLFLATELPQGILALCSGVSDDFFVKYYTPLGDVMDIVALINNGVNFTLYCSMSKKFRQMFFELFCCCLPKVRSPSRKNRTKVGTGTIKAVSMNGHVVGRHLPLPQQPKSSAGTRFIEP